MSGLDRLKREIDFPSYLTHLGYKIDRKKSTRVSLVMKLNEADKIVVSRRNGIWIYFSVYDDRDNGTIIDFVKNRTQKSIPEISMDLMSWHGSATLMPGVSVEAIQENKISPERIKRLFKRCSIALDHSYLKSRGIHQEVLASTRFHGRIFQDHFSNAVFPHFKNGAVCGLELKGESTGLFVRGSEKTLWRSNLSKKDSSLIIAEAPIDSLSYHILFRPSSAFYIATSGGFSKPQSIYIQKLIEAIPSITKIILITDHDEGGNRLAERLSAAINQAGFNGQLIRHSPSEFGQDWNDALKAKLGI